MVTSCPQKPSFCMEYQQNRGIDYPLFLCGRRMSMPPIYGVVGVLKLLDAVAVAQISAGGAG